MKVHVFYQPIDLGPCPVGPQYVGEAETMAGARAVAERDARQNGRIFRNYSWRRSGKLFTPEEATALQERMNKHARKP